MSFYFIDIQLFFDTVVGHGKVKHNGVIIIIFCFFIKNINIVFKIYIKSIFFQFGNIIIGQESIIFNH